MDKLIQRTNVLSLTKPIISHNCGIFSAITFDDGFASVLENAIPELTKRNIWATIFIPTSNLGMRPKWIKDPQDPLNHETVMSAEQLIELSKNDLISFGSHCKTHSNLLLLTEDEIINELNDSKHLLESILGNKVEMISFPHGSYNQHIINWAREAGYKLAFNIEPIPAFMNKDEYSIGRIEVSPADWRLEYLLKLSGAYRWLIYAYKLKKRLAFCHN